MQGAKMKCELSGIGISEQYLTVGLTLHLNGTMRFLSVKVPVHLLLEKGIAECLDRQVRRDLIERWSEVDLGDPLF